MLPYIRSWDVHTGFARSTNVGLTSAFVNVSNTVESGPALGTCAGISYEMPVHTRAIIIARTAVAVVHLQAPGPPSIGLCACSAVNWFYLDLLLISF